MIGALIVLATLALLASTVMGLALTNAVVELLESIANHRRAQATTIMHHAGLLDVFEPNPDAEE